MDKTKLSFSVSTKYKQGLRCENLRETMQSIVSLMIFPDCFLIEHYKIYKKKCSFVYYRRNYFGVTKILEICIVNTKTLEKRITASSQSMLICPRHSVDMAGGDG